MDIDGMGDDEVITVALLLGFDYRVMHTEGMTWGTYNGRWGRTLSTTRAAGARAYLRTRENVMPE